MLTTAVVFVSSLQVLNLTNLIVSYLQQMSIGLKNCMYIVKAPDKRGY